jgi:hypothetical protein
VNKINEFVAPKSSTTEPVIVHTPYAEVSSNKAFLIKAQALGVDTSDKVSVEVRNSSGKWKTVNMTRNAFGEWVTEVPADMVAPGIINYRIILQKTNKEFFTFPGGHKGNPYAWDYYQNESWQTYVAGTISNLEVFNASADRNILNLYNPDWRNNTFEYILAEKPRQLILKATMNKPMPGYIIGFECFVADKLKGRSTELSSFERLVIRTRSAGEKSMKIRVAIITSDGASFASYVAATNKQQDIAIPFSSLQRDSALLLPRPYPSFQPLRFMAATTAPFSLREADKLQVTLVSDQDGDSNNPLSFEVESVWFERKP